LAALTISSKKVRIKRRLLEMQIGKPFYLPAAQGNGDDGCEARQRNAELVTGKYRGYMLIALWMT
jgi:hypothetical protein